MCRGGRLSLPTAVIVSSRTEAACAPGSIQLWLLCTSSAVRCSTRESHVPVLLQFVRRHLVAHLSSFVVIPPVRVCASKQWIMTESTKACHRRHFTLQVRRRDFHTLFASLACALLAFVMRSSISPVTEPLMSRQTSRYVAFFFSTSFCPLTVITTFPALISRFVRAFPRPTASSKISNFPTLALRWLASKTSMTAWIHTCQVLP